MFDISPKSTMESDFYAVSRPSNAGLDSRHLGKTLSEIKPHMAEMVS